MKLLLIVCYLFLLGVLLPHTAWMFSMLEPPGFEGLGWAAAIAFEITIAVLTHFLAKEIAAVSKFTVDIKTKLKDELLNIPASLLITTIIISVVANWTHAYQYAGNTPFGSYAFAKGLYSVLFGGILPVCSFAYAYVLSQVYRKDQNSEQIDKETATWYKLVDAARKSGKHVTPVELARLANVDESMASKVITEAMQSGIITNNNRKD